MMGDCKGNDLLCDRSCGHSLKIKGLHRHCSMSPYEGDWKNIDEPLKRSFITKEDVKSKNCNKPIIFFTYQQKITFLTWVLENAHGVHSGTPAEISHSTQLDMRAHAAESLEIIFTKFYLDFISNSVTGIYEDSHL